PCGRRAPLSAVPPRASRHHPKGRAPDRKQPDSRHLVGGPPALREVERAPRSAARTPHAPGPVQGPRRRLVRSPPHPSGGTRASRPRDGLGSGARNLGRRIPTRGLRRRPRATLSRRPGKVHPSQRASQRSAWPSSTNSGSRRSEEHTSELQSLAYLVCRLLLEKKKPDLNGHPPSCRIATSDVIRVRVYGFSKIRATDLFGRTGALTYFEQDSKDNAIGPCNCYR